MRARISRQRTQTWLAGLCLVIEAGCGSTPIGPSAAPSATTTVTTASRASQDDARTVAQGVDRVLAAAFDDMAEALADGRSSLRLDRTAACSGGGTARITGGWNGTLPRDGSGTIAFDIRIGFGDDAERCREGSAEVSGELWMKGDVVFGGGQAAEPTFLQEGGELEFVLDGVRGTLRRTCVHAIHREGRVVCDGEVAVEYPAGTPILPAPAC